MPDSESFVHDFLLPDSNSRRTHVGDACQWSPPVPEGEVEPPVAAMIAAHRASIHAPGSRVRGRFGLDEEGNPIETSYLGVWVDPETGAVRALDAEGNPILPGEEPVPEPVPAPAPAPVPAPEPAPGPSATTSTTSSGSSSLS